MRSKSNTPLESVEGKEDVATIENRTLQQCCFVAMYNFQHHGTFRSFPLVRIAGERGIVDAWEMFERWVAIHTLSTTLGGTDVGVLDEVCASDRWRLSFRGVMLVEAATHVEAYSALLSALVTITNSRVQVNRPSVVLGWMKGREEAKDATAADGVEPVKLASVVEGLHDTTKDMAKWAERERRYEESKHTALRERIYKSNDIHLAHWMEAGMLTAADLNSIRRWRSNGCQERHMVELERFDLHTLYRWPDAVLDELAARDIITEGQLGVARAKRAQAVFDGGGRREPQPPKTIVRGDVVNMFHLLMIDTNSNSPPSIVGRGIIVDKRSDDVSQTSSSGRTILEVSEVIETKGSRGHTPTTVIHHAPDVLQKLYEDWTPYEISEDTVTSLFKALELDLFVKTEAEINGAVDMALAARNDARFASDPASYQWIVTQPEAGKPHAPAVHIVVFDVNSEDGFVATGEASTYMDAMAACRASLAAYFRADGDSWKYFIHAPPKQDSHSPTVDLVEFLNAFSLKSRAGIDLLGVYCARGKNPTTGLPRFGCTLSFDGVDLGGECFSDTKRGARTACAGRILHRIGKSLASAYMTPDVARKLLGGSKSGAGKK